MSKTAQIDLNKSELELLYQYLRDRRPRKLCITAPHAGCGVTTLALALAYRSAIASVPTLLLELNLDNPVLAESTGVERKAWTLDDPMAGVQAIQGLPMSVLPASLDPENRMALREPSALKELIGKVTQEYELTIFDSAAINYSGTSLIPAENAASMCEATLMVVQSLVTQGSDVSDAADRLHRRGARLLGTVIFDYDNPGMAGSILEFLKEQESRFPAISQALAQYVEKSNFLNLRI